MRGYGKLRLAVRNRHNSNRLNNAAFRDTETASYWSDAALLFSDRADLCLSGVTVQLV